MVNRMTDGKEMSFPSHLHSCFFIYSVVNVCSLFLSEIMTQFQQFNSLKAQHWMGVKQSVHIETPELNLNDWDYLPEQPEISEEYGLFRTLKNRKTGEMVDQYNFIWPNEQEYNYYLKSFNWRHKQPNVVNTRFIKLNNSEEICSQSFTAKIFIEHIKIRISQISDIPYPDNLYVLMESFEGFSKIYEHSKYFEIEQNQICVDEFGNIKIWVNSDLSMNYPTNQGYIDYKQKGEEEMVEMIVNIVAANTDPEIEPTPTFKDFYEQKKGSKGKRFEEAKVMVLNYARLYDTEIPDKFEAILNMDKDETDIGSMGNKSQHNPIKDRVHYESEERSGNQCEQYYPNPQPNQVYPFPPHDRQFIYNSAYPSPYPNAFPQYPPQHQPLYSIPNQMYQHQPNFNPNPVYYIPHYPRIQYPVIQMGDPNQFQGSLYHPPQAVPFLISSQSPQNSRHGQMALPPPLLNRNSKKSDKQPSGNEMMKGTIINTLNDQVAKLQAEKNYNLSSDHVEQKLTEKENLNTIHKRNNSFGNSISEGDDLVARSLPIKAGYPAAQNNQQLSTMGQERAIYSHINPKDQYSNKDGFGLTRNSQLKLKESALSNHKSNNLIPKPKKDQKPIKYFYSLEQQLQIDPDIAADMAKYLS